MFQHYAFTDRPIYGYEDPLFLTNFGTERRYYYEEAIEAYHKEIGEAVLTITDIAEGYGPYGIIDPLCNALRYIAAPRRDLSRFWRIFEQVKSSDQSA